MTHMQIGKKILAQTVTHQANANNLHTILHHLNMGLKVMVTGDDDEKLNQEASCPPPGQ